MSEQEEARSERADAEASQQSESDQAAEAREPLDALTVLKFCIGQLAALAWQKMGLQADPITNQIHKDIAQARLAIDSVAALVEKLRPHLEGQEARDYQSLVTDLRLNFLNQSEAQP